METARRAEPEAVGPIAKQRSPSLLGGDIGDVEGAIGRGLEAVMAVTRSPVGFVGLVDEAGETQLISRTEDREDLSSEAMMQLARRVMEGGQAVTPTQPFIGAQLRAGDVLL